MYRAYLANVEILKVHAYIQVESLASWQGGLGKPVSSFFPMRSAVEQSSIFALRTSSFQTNMCCRHEVYLIRVACIYS